MVMRSGTRCIPLPGPITIWMCVSSQHKMRVSAAAVVGYKYYCQSHGSLNSMHPKIPHTNSSETRSATVPFCAVTRALVFRWLPVFLLVGSLLLTTQDPGHRSERSADTIKSCRWNHMSAELVGLAEWEVMMDTRYHNHTIVSPIVQTANYDHRHDDQQHTRAAAATGHGSTEILVSACHR